MMDILKSGAIALVGCLIAAIVLGALAWAVEDKRGIVDEGMRRHVAALDRDGWDNMIVILALAGLAVKFLEAM